MRNFLSYYYHGLLGLDYEMREEFRQDTSFADLVRSIRNEKEEKMLDLLCGKILLKILLTAEKRKYDDYMCVSCEIVSVDFVEIPKEQRAVRSISHYGTEVTGPEIEQIVRAVIGEHQIPDGEFDLVSDRYIENRHNLLDLKHRIHSKRRDDHCSN